MDFETQQLQYLLQFFKVQTSYLQQEVHYISGKWDAINTHSRLFQMHAASIFKLQHKNLITEYSTTQLILTT